MGQLRFFDLNRRYESLTEKNDPLVPGEATLTPLILVVWRIISRCVRIRDIPAA
jgi:hypothetical protein